MHGLSGQSLDLREGRADLLIGWLRGVREGSKIFGLSSWKDDVAVM